MGLGFPTFDGGREVRHWRIGMQASMRSVRRRHARGDSGFSMIEVMIVVALIGILAAAAA